MNLFERTDEFDSWLSGLKDNTDAHELRFAFALRNTAILAIVIR